MVLTIATIQMPRPPVLHRQADRAIVILFAFGGHRKHIADKQLWYEFFIVVMHLHRTIDPTDALFNRRFGLNQHEWQAVDQQHQIGARRSVGPAR